MASSSWDTNTQEDEFEIELDVLQGAPFGPAPHLDSLDGDLLDMTVDVQDVRRRAAVAQVSAGGDIVSRRLGGWKYSIGRLLQAMLFAHYLRCAAHFARSVILAVSFALGPQAWFLRW